MEEESNEKSSVTESQVEKINAVELNSMKQEHEKITHVKSGSAAICMKVTGILVMLLGLIVSTLNIIFIYFGIHSDWYNGNIGVLKVISVGEGIIAGTFYIIISFIVLFYLSKKEPSAVRMIILCNIFLLVISFTLSIVNGCQIGMVEFFFPESFETDQEVIMAEEEKKDQMDVLIVQMVAHMMVLVISAIDIVGSTKLFKKDY